MENSYMGINSDLVRIHKVFSRALQVIQTHGQVFSKTGFPDAAVQAGFSSYVNSFDSLLHAHHITEEEILFPFFRLKMPDEPFDLLLVQHSDIAASVYQIRDLLGSQENQNLDVYSLSELVQVVAKIDQVWHPHIGIEESIFVPDKINPLASLEEQFSLNGQLAQHSMKHASPDYLVIPFILYNLPPVDRQEMSRLMPPVITQQLVPLVWKEKWQIMQPFLLE
jgi:hemerythrin-like domain-containing protein